MLTKYIVYVEYLMLLISFDIDFSFDKKQFVSYIFYFDIKYIFDKQTESKLTQNSTNIFNYNFKNISIFL